MSKYIFDKVLNIENVEKIKSDLQEVLNSGEKIILDTSQIEEISTPAMQLLVCLFREAIANDKDISLLEPINTELIASANLLGISDEFAL